MFVKDSLGLTLHRWVDWNIAITLITELALMSHLTQVSGLKSQTLRPTRYTNEVSPYTGEWIEIRIKDFSSSLHICLTLHRWVDWNLNPLYNFVSQKVSPYTGEWIEMSQVWVDVIANLVSPYTGEWIEIYLSPPFPRCSSVSPYTGEWIEIFFFRDYPKHN